MKRFHSHTSGAGGGSSGGGGQGSRFFGPVVPVGMDHHMGASQHMMNNPVHFDGMGGGSPGASSLMGNMPLSMGPPDTEMASHKKGYGPRGMMGGMGTDSLEYFSNVGRGSSEMSPHHSSGHEMYNPATTRGGSGGNLTGDLGAKAAALHAGINGQYKRQRTSGSMVQEQAGPAVEDRHQDVLMELARENLLLKHQLHVATLEMSRLTAVLNGFQQQTPQDEPKAKQKQSQSRYWTEQEHQRFLEAMQSIGHKDVKAIASVVGTRSATQVRTHAQKFFMKMARFKKQDEGGKVNTNPDTAPSETDGQDDNCTGTAAAAAAAAGEAGTSAAAAAAFVAASHSKTSMSVTNKSSSKSTPALESISTSSKQQPATAKQLQPSMHISSKKKNPGSPGSMDSNRSVGSSDDTSNGRSNGTTSNDNTNGNGSSSSNNSNRNGNEESCSDSVRGDSNNGVSSNEGSDHGFFDTGAEEEAFVDDLQFQNGDDHAKTGFEFAETTAT